jgi:uncharacterized protein (DUF4415 family)
MCASRTNWTRIREMSQAEADKAAAGDPENPPLTKGQLARLRVVMPDPKRSVTIRLDDRVVEYFKATGPGYQTRINAVLRAYVDAAAEQRPRRKAR